MICPGLPRLDAEQFAKRLALADRGATKGERAAALAAAHRIAARYGLSPVAATPEPPSNVARAACNVLRFGLTHHCEIVEIGNESWRFKNRA